MRLLKSPSGSGRKHGWSMSVAVALVAAIVGIGVGQQPTAAQDFDPEMLHDPIALLQQRIDRGEVKLLGSRRTRGRDSGTPNRTFRPGSKLADSNPPSLGKEPWATDLAIPCAVYSLVAPFNAGDLVSVAQSVERWIVAPVVAGSIPVAHPFQVDNSGNSRGRLRG